MNRSSRRRLPPITLEPPPPREPDPRFRADERKQVGPDFGEEHRRRETARSDGAEPPGRTRD